MVSDGMQWWNEKPLAAPLVFRSKPFSEEIQPANVKHYAMGYIVAAICEAFGMVGNQVEGAFEILIRLEREEPSGHLAKQG
jgi:hypothetical protein